MTSSSKPEVVAYRHVNKEHPTLRDVSLLQDPSCHNELVKVEPLIRLSDYEALQAECEKLRSIISDLKDWDCDVSGGFLSLPLEIRRRMQVSLAAHRKQGGG